MIGQARHPASGSRLRLNVRAVLAEQVQQRRIETLRPPVRNLLAGPATRVSSPSWNSSEPESREKISAAGDFEEAKWFDGDTVRPQDRRHDEPHIAHDGRRP